MLLYDPPSGHRHGFPRPYLPLKGESLIDTLIRDGYPVEDAEFGSKHCRFMGTQEELDALRAADDIEDAKEVKNGS